MAKKLNSTNVGTGKASKNMSAGRKTTKATTKPSGGRGKPTNGTGKNASSLKNKGRVKGAGSMQKDKLPNRGGSVGSAAGGKMKSGSRTYKASTPKGSKGGSKSGWKPKGRK